MELKELQKAYGEILAAYDSVFPSHPERKAQSEDETDLSEIGEESG